MKPCIGMLKEANNGNKLTAVPMQVSPWTSTESNRSSVHVSPLTLQLLRWTQNLIFVPVIINFDRCYDFFYPLRNPLELWKQAYCSFFPQVMITTGMASESYSSLLLILPYYSPIPKHYQAFCRLHFYSCMEQAQEQSSNSIDIENPTLDYCQYLYNNIIKNSSMNVNNLLSPTYYKRWYYSSL